MKPQTFIDQSEAEDAADKFIMSKLDLEQKPFYDISQHSLGLNSQMHVDGRLTTLWFHRNIIAQTVVVRDDFNRSVLTCVDFTEVVE